MIKVATDTVTSGIVAGLASRLGSFESRLLREVGADGDDAYCAELSRRLSHAEGKEVSVGQVSRTLGVLKRLGLLTSETRLPPTPQKHKRSRLVFALADSGIVTNALSGDNAVNIDQYTAALDAKDREIARLLRMATDRRYMMDAYRSMLGPKGIEVVRMWDEKGVQRVHHDWGPRASEMGGEERAQVILDLELQLLKIHPRRTLSEIDGEIIDHGPDA